MELRRQIEVLLIVCCANIIHVEGLGDSEITTSNRSEEEFNKGTELKHGNLCGTITAHKDGAKLEFALTYLQQKINSAVTWNKNICVQSKPYVGVEHKGEKGVKEIEGLPGPQGAKGEKGDKGLDGLIGPQGEKGEKGNVGSDGLPGLQGGKGEMGDRGPEGYKGSPGDSGRKGEKGDKGDDGLKGIEGKKGDKGDKAIDGLKGEKGEPCTTSYESYGERSPDDYGSIDHPAYSCVDIADGGKYYVNPAKPFEVLCKDYESCIPNLSKNINSFNLSGDKKVWLSTLDFSLNKFYNLNISQLTYLMSTNDDYHYTLRYNNEVIALKMLTWNGITMEIESISLWKACKGTLNKQEAYTDLKVQCKLPYYIPLDFYVEATIEMVYVNLINLCFK